MAVAERGVRRSWGILGANGVSRDSCHTAMTIVTLTLRMGLCDTCHTAQRGGGRCDTGHEPLPIATAVTHATLTHDPRRGIRTHARTRTRTHAPARSLARRAVTAVTLPLLYVMTPRQYPHTVTNSTPQNAGTAPPMPYAFLVGHIPPTRQCEGRRGRKPRASARPAGEGPRSALSQSPTGARPWWGSRPSAPLV